MLCGQPPLGSVIAFSRKTSYVAPRMSLFSIPRAPCFVLVIICALRRSEGRHRARWCSTTTDSHHTVTSFALQSARSFLISFSPCALLTNTSCPLPTGWLCTYYQNLGMGHGEVGYINPLPSFLKSLSPRTDNSSRKTVQHQKEMPVSFSPFLLVRPISTNLKCLWRRLGSALPESSIHSNAASFRYYKSSGTKPINS